MAADLRLKGTIRDEHEAMRVLMTGPYRWGDIVSLAEHALFEARQQPLAKTMGRPS